MERRITASSEKIEIRFRWYPAREGEAFSQSLYRLRRCLRIHFPCRPNNSNHQLGNLLRRYHDLVLPHQLPPPSNPHSTPMRFLKFFYGIDVRFSRPQAGNTCMELSVIAIDRHSQNNSTSLLLTN
ncbi:unnamed protein product [Linum trigynum]|uniref:Uncharacterized protein n=1 Tax=Linum trigynum TaxID=586398 RepID=A0AAV2DPU9_9ROSI